MSHFITDKDKKALKKAIKLMDAAKDLIFSIKAEEHALDITHEELDIATARLLDVVHGEDE